MTKNDLIAYRIRHSFGLTMKRCPSCGGRPTVSKLFPNLMQITCPDCKRTLTERKHPDHDFKQFVCLVTVDWNSGNWKDEKK